jgi:archaellin
MKNLVILSAVVVALISTAFTLTEKSTEMVSQKTCEYSFYVKCEGSSQFKEIIRAKSSTEAKTICENRYKSCNVRPENSTGKNCN